VNFRIAGVFGGLAMLGTLIGVRVARFVPGATQLLIFAAVMLAAAIFMMRGDSPGKDSGSGHGVDHAVPAIKVAPGALLVGSLTGIVGVGGGFLIVPALVLMRLSVRQAVGTSLLVITGTCVVGFLGYLGHVRLDWAAVALVAAGTLPGMALGSYLHGFVPQSILRRGFAVFLIVMAAVIFIDSAGALEAASARR
jgi:uncharacterized membrane protein YfcA